MEFKNLLEFVRYFDSEQKCKAYLALKRWGGKPVCPHCGNDRVYTTNVGYKCASNTCYKKFSVTKGTIYEASNVPLTKWFLAEYLIINHKKGISSYQLSRDIQVTQKTAWFMLHRIREQMTSKSVVQFKGVVMADETYIGGAAKNKHEWQRKELIKKGTGGANKSAVLGFLSEGQVKTFVIKNPNRETVHPLLLTYVYSQSTLVTDGHGAYTGLEHVYKGVTVNHGKGEYVNGGYSVNALEGFWSHLKRGIDGIYHQVSPKHLHRYCNEFAHRWNTRALKDYQRVDIAIGIDCRLTYKQLVNAS